MGDRNVPPPAGTRILEIDRVHETQAAVSQIPPSKAGDEPCGPASHRLVDGVGVWCAAGYGALAYLARQPGEPELSTFFVLVAWTGLPVFGLYFYLRRLGEPLPVGRMFLWAVIFRLCGLVGGPFFEDDFYRYLWDGYRFATAGTPYGAAPEAFFLDTNVPAAFQQVLDGINNPDLPTIYGPATQFLFLLGYWLQPGSVTALQLILILTDLLMVWTLLRLAPAQNVMLYAWCPLVIKEIAFTAHPDGAGACLLMAAILLVRNRRPGRAAVCLGVAAGAKIFALVLAPLVLMRTRPRPLAAVRRHTGRVICSVFPDGGYEPHVIACVRTGMGVQFRGIRLAGNSIAAIRGPADSGSGVRRFLAALCRQVRARRSTGHPPGRLALRSVAGDFSGDQPLVPALAAAVCGHLPERLGLDRLQRRPAQLHDRYPSG